MPSILPADLCATGNGGKLGLQCWSRAREALIRKEFAGWRSALNSLGSHRQRAALVLHQVLAFGLVFRVELDFGFRLQCAGFCCQNADDIAHVATATTGTSIRVVLALTLLLTPNTTNATTTATMTATTTSAAETFICTF